MNLKVLGLLPGGRSSSIPAPAAVSTDSLVLTADAGPQIPRRPAGVRLRQRQRYADRLRLDLHLPLAAGPHPLVVYVPGGGFMVARRGMARPARAFVAAAGFAVASIEYRTVRQGATFVDAMDDIRSALTYLTDHGGELGADPGRIGLWGESAGGYLASLVGLSDDRVRAVVDQFGASDVSRLADGFDAQMQAAVADPRHPVHRFGAMQANPSDLARAGAAPFLLLHGDDDRIVSPNQTEALHRALLAAGAESTRYVLAGAGHGPLARNRRQARQWTSVRVLTIITDFLQEQLRR